MNWPARSNLPVPDDRRIAKHARRIQQAQAFHALGNLQEAERICARLLAKRPSDFDALYLLAAIKSAQGHLSEALALIAKALKTNSRSTEALINHGYLLSRLERLDEALASYDRVVEINPDFVEAHNGRGCVLLDMQRPAEALECFTKALTIKPHYADALNNAGKALLDLGRPQDAASSLDQAVKVQSGHAEAHFNLGNAFRELGQPIEALASYERAVAFNPAHAEALGNRGVVLWELGRPDDALASFDEALAISPGHVNILNSRGCLMLELGRQAEAAIDFDKALEGWPDFAEARYGRGCLMLEQGRYADAAADLEEVFEAQPDFAEARYNRGLLRLLLGDMREGWTDYEWRWQVEELAPLRRWFSQPQWTGKEPVEGKVVLLHAEQGFGDTIQFVRYVSLVTARGAKVVLEVQPQLKRLVAGLHESALVVGRGEPLPPFDCHCPLLSLPLACDTQLDTIPAKVPYIDASQEDMRRWADRIPRSKRLRVGIAWSGTARRKNDRSIPLSDLGPLLAASDIQFISLQKELRDHDETTLRAHPDLLHFGDELGDFADTAALMSALDLIISIDTSVAHLAGALGRPVWIMLPSVPDFRWLLGRRDSPWYPTARLFRQPQTGDWSSVIASVCDELQH